MNKVFAKETRWVIQNNVVEHLNGINLMSKSTINSPRAVGDAVQEVLEHTFASLIPDGIVKDFSAVFARLRCYVEFWAILFATSQSSRALARLCSQGYGRFCLY